MEAMPNIQARIVEYDMKNGTHVTQQRFYAVDEQNKWRQIKNIDVRGTQENPSEFAVAFGAALTPAVPELRAEAANVAMKTTEKVAAPSRIHNSVHMEDIDKSRVLRPRADRNKQLVAAAFTGELHADDEAYLDKLIKAEKEAEVASAAAAVTAAAMTDGKVGFLQRARTKMRNGYDKFIEFKDYMVEKPRRIAAAAAMVGLAGVSLIGIKTDASPLERTASASETTTTEEGNSSTSTSARERATTTTTLSDAQYEERYGNRSTGEHAANELGYFLIDTNDKDKSLNNLYEELRHNPDALAYWNECFNSGTPGYDACVEDAARLAKANELADQYTEMPAKQKATIAESVIAKFKDAKFTGFTIESGHYKTVAVDANGNFIPATNTRSNDPRMNFEFEGEDGNTYKVQIRSCVQITESEVVKKPEVPKTTTTTPPVEETTTTTAPPEEDTTTTSSTSSSSTSSTSSTSSSSTSSTSTSSTSTSSTSTTTPPSSTTVVTLPKTEPTSPEGEVTTTVTVGDTTPEQPTTSTVPQPSTSVTSPMDTIAPTSTIEIPADIPGVNEDFVFPLAGGGFATVSLGKLVNARKKRENEANNKAA